MASAVEVQNGTYGILSVSGTFIEAAQTSLSLWSYISGSLQQQVGSQLCLS